MVVVALAVVGFTIYGVATSAPSTAGYVGSVVLVGIGLLVLRRAPLPAGLAIALAVDAVAHLAGGMITVDEDVLYDLALFPQIGGLETHLFQYDHLVHAYGSGVATVTLWVLLVPVPARVWGRHHLITLAVLAGMGVGAANELIEFVATMAHHGAHVGGYANTGWDLVANTVGALVGALVIARSRTLSGSTPATAP